MRFFLLLALLGLSAAPAPMAQTPPQRSARYRYWEANRDSLHHLLATQSPDTARLRTLRHLRDVGFISAAEARETYRELAQLARRLRRPEAPAYRLYVAYLALTEAKAPPAQQLDTARAALAASDRVGLPAAELISPMARLLTSLESPAAAVAFLHARAARARQRGMPEELYMCYRVLGGTYVRRGDYNQGISYSLRAADQGRAYNRYRQQNELVVAGYYYAEWGNPAKALHFLRQGRAVNRTLPRRDGFDYDAYPYWGMAKAYRQLGDSPAALRCADSSLVGTPTDTTRSYTGMVLSVRAYGWVVKSAVLLDLRRVAEAGALLARAQHLADSLQLGLSNPSLGVIELDATWARYHAARGEPARAETAWLAAYGKARALKLVPLRLAYLGALADFYAQRGQALPAGRYARAALALSDSLRTQQGAFQVAQYEAERANQVQNERIAALRQAQVRDAARGRRQRWVLGATLAVLAVLAGLGFVLWRSNRRQQHANAQLQAQRDRTAQALKHLQATQAQLIQAEKMASLGELTAGIAHEIQNPLNFVNNFSEVSSELLDELAGEQAKPHRDAELEAELVGDLQQNLGKITEHGKRAAGIVRGMLEHSRQSSGERAPTDLNALCDEYLRLSYHGLRAKDKSFNAELKTAFDPGLPAVSVVSGDIGRVLLNLLTNAFYAVKQRQQRGEAGYQPTVRVSTKQANGQVEIRVTDNGTGMPESVKAKIFQPFFTTKPTGEGTGLGLSLSYDIVTKGHGGTLRAESTQGQGTEFVIALPLAGPAG